MRRIIAILVAAALLLTSCGIAFRNEIQEIFNELFITLKYDGNNPPKTLEEIYILGYLPDGYVLHKEMRDQLAVKYIFVNDEGNIFTFEQGIIEGSKQVVDSDGYSRFLDLVNFDIYYRFTGDAHIYVWSDEKYWLILMLENEMPNKEIISIIEGITAK